MANAAARTLRVTPRIRSCGQGREGEGQGRKAGEKARKKASNDPKDMGRIRQMVRAPGHA